MLLLYEIVHYRLLLEFQTIVFKFINCHMFVTSYNSALTCYIYCLMCSDVSKVINIVNLTLEK